MRKVGIELMRKGMTLTEYIGDIHNERNIASKCWMENGRRIPFVVFEIIEYIVEKR